MELKSIRCNDVVVNHGILDNNDEDDHRSGLKPSESPLGSNGCHCNVESDENCWRNHVISNSDCCTDVDGHKICEGVRTIPCRKEELDPSNVIENLFADSKDYGGQIGIGLAFIENKPNNSNNSNNNNNNNNDNSNHNKDKDNDKNNNIINNSNNNNNSNSNSNDNNNRNSNNNKHSNNNNSNNNNNNNINNNNNNNNINNNNNNNRTTTSKDNYNKSSNNLVELIHRMKHHLIDIKIDENPCLLSKNQTTGKWRVSAPTSLRIPSKQSDWKTKLNESRCSTNSWRHSSPDLRIPSCSNPARLWQSKLSEGKGRRKESEKSDDKWKFSLRDFGGDRRKMCGDGAVERTKCDVLHSDERLKDDDWTVSLSSIQHRNHKKEPWITLGS